jgi:hypothetical protein
MIPAAAQGKLSYRTLSISFPDACALTASTVLHYRRRRISFF